MWKIGLLMLGANFFGALAQVEIITDEAKVPKVVLPDLLMLSDGTRVTDAGIWREKR